MKKLGVLSLFIMVVLWVSVTGAVPPGTAGLGDTRQFLPWTEGSGIPSGTSDYSNGFRQGQLYFDNVAQELWYAIRVTTGAADWARVTLDKGGSEDTGVSWYGTGNLVDGTIHNSTITETLLSSVTPGAGEPLRLQNLLTNSRSSVWSNSEGIFAVHTSLVSGYVKTTGTSITVLDVIPFNVGDLISTSAGFVNDGTGGIADTDTGTSVYEITAITADGGSHYLTVEGDAQVLTADSAITDVFRIRPGLIAGNNLDADGWYRDSTADVFREGTSGTTKAGSYYALKMTATATDDFRYWPTATERTLVEHYERFRGRTVAFGVWVHTSTASQVFIQLIDSDTIDYNQTSDSSSFHTGGGSYEWLEVTMTVGTDTTEFSAAFVVDSAGDIFYSQPMLVFGSSIGEGNYTAPIEEVVRLESSITLIDYNGTPKTTAADVPINLEVQSRGKLPKNLSGIFMQTLVRDSSSSSADAVFSLGADVSKIEAAVLNIGNAGLNQVNNGFYYEHTEVNTNVDGNIEAEIVASGTLTLDAWIIINSVTLR